MGNLVNSINRVQKGVEDLDDTQSLGEVAASKKGPRMRRGGRGVYVPKEVIRAKLKTRPRVTPYEAKQGGMWMRRGNRYDMMLNQGRKGVPGWNTLPKSKIQRGLLRLMRDSNPNARKNIMGAYKLVANSNVGRYARRAKTPLAIAGMAGAGVLGAHLASRRANKVLAAYDIQKIHPHAQRVRGDWVRTGPGKYGSRKPKFPKIRPSFIGGYNNRLKRVNRKAVLQGLAGGAVVAAGAYGASKLRRKTRKSVGTYDISKAVMRRVARKKERPFHATYSDRKDWTTRREWEKDKPRLKRKTKKSVTTDDIMKSMKNRNIADSMNSVAFRKGVLGRVVNNMRPTTKTHRRLSKSQSPF